MRIPKRADIVPGARLTVRRGRRLNLNAHLIAWSADFPVPAGTRVTVVDGPRKVDNINLVRLELTTGSCTNTYEAFYCDVLGCCELDDGAIPGETC